MHHHGAVYIHKRMFSIKIIVEDYACSKASWSSHRLLNLLVSLTLVGPAYLL
jgi:hypothetical protein